MSRFLQLFFLSFAIVAFPFNPEGFAPYWDFRPFSLLSLMEQRLGSLEEKKTLSPPPIPMPFSSNPLILNLKEQTALPQKKTQSSLNPEKQEKKTPRSRIGYLEFKPGAQIFTTKTMRKIYGEVNFSGKVEGGVIFYRPLTLWFDMGYFQNTGRVINGTEKTKIKLGTATIGLKSVFFDRERLAFYVGGGPRLFVYRDENNSPFVNASTHKTGIGGGAIAGLWFFPFSGTQGYMDIFVDYSIKKFSPPSQGDTSLVFDIKLNNLTFGLGLGVAF